jgi:hypothetical protein
MSNFGRLFGISAKVNFEWLFGIGAKAGFDMMASGGRAKKWTRAE